MRKNRDIVRRLREEGFVGGNVDVVDELFAEDFVDHDPSFPGGRGREGMRQWCQAVVDAFSERTLSREDFLISRGERLAEYWALTGINSGSFMGLPPSGKQATLTGIEVWSLTYGKIVERWASLDELGLLEEIGAIPPR